MYLAKQKDIEMLYQSNKQMYYKIELLDRSYRILDYLEGNLISDSLSINADSDIRRTYNCEILVTDSSFNINSNSKIWFDKIIRPYIGIKYERTGEILWYLLGTFLFNDYNYNFDVTTRTLSLTCNDMMCLLNDTRSGQLDSYQRKIKVDSDARSIIIAILKEIGITEYMIEFNINNTTTNTFKIPYDKTFSSGSNAYQIIKEIIDLYPGTEMYFDINGLFTIGRKPTGDNEIYIPSEVFNDIIISEKLNSSLNNIYNRIEVWGKVNEPSYYCNGVYNNSTDHIYSLSLVSKKYEYDSDGTTPKIIDYTSYSNGDTFAFKVPATNSTIQKININNIGAYPIQDENGAYITSGILQAGTDYVFRYRKSVNGNDNFLLLGSYQNYGCAYLTNNYNDHSEYAVIDVNSEMCVEKLGTLRKVLSDNEADNITSDNLCCQRARMELYNTIRMNETLSLKMILIPWLDVNQLIEYTSLSTGETNKYLINSISYNNVECTMDVQLTRYYPNYINKNQL